MLRKMNDLESYAICATDGRVGHVKNFYFDDDEWAVRYFVVETGSWLSNCKVLILPVAAGRPIQTRKVLPVSITKEQVRNSPDIHTDKPALRQHEVRYLGYYGQPSYWNMPHAVVSGVYPNAMLTDTNSGGGAKSYLSQAVPAAAETDAQRQDGDMHLRSARAVVGYHIAAADGDIGHLQGLIVDDATWLIRYMVVDTSNWWVGHEALIAPQWIQQIRWRETTVSVTVTRQTGRDAGRYHGSVPLN